MSNNTSMISIIPDGPLNKRGKNDAPRIGKLLKDEDLIPDLIMSSTAVRAKKTAELVAKAGKYKGKIVLNHSLYGAEPATYLKILGDFLINIWLH
jgi:phosphohistidine phosphatase